MSQQAAKLPDTEQRAVFSVVERFLACIAANDPDRMATFFIPTAHATLFRRTLGEWEIESRLLSEQVAKIPWGPKRTVPHDEICVGTPVVHIDGEFASVWNPFEYYIDGALHHTGVTTFTLWKRLGEDWIVTCISDIGRRSKSQAL